MAADKDDVSGAIAKLAAADNYSWKTSVSNVPPPDAAGGGGGGRRGGRGFGGGPSSGKTQKDGLIYVNMAGRGGVTEGYVQGAKAAVKAGDDAAWASFAEATADDGNGGFNMAAMTARRVQMTKTPADTAKDLLEKVKSVTKADDAYTADLTEDGAKSFMTMGFAGFGRGGGAGGNGPDISGAKGTVKFWVKDGVLVKYETHVEGTMSFGGNDRPLNTITTVEITDVGSTKIEVPDDAKKKLS